jgi:hypothetical protein
VDLTPTAMYALTGTYYNSILSAITFPA